MQDTMRTDIKQRIAPERIPGVYRDTGAGIYLRLMTREDTDRIVAWRNSDAVRKNFIYQALFTRESHENWIRNHATCCKLFRFFISVLVPKSEVPAYLTDRFTSALMDPS